MTPANGSLDVIEIDQCYDLLASHEVGRIGVNAEHFPLIIPVNYGMDGRTIVVRTHPGTTLTAAAHANVTFEVDEIDRTTRSGWSVLIRGLAEEVGAEHREDLVARTYATGVAPWAPGEEKDPAAPHRSQARGGPLQRGRLPWGVDERAYL